MEDKIVNWLSERAKSYNESGKTWKFILGTVVGLVAFLSIGYFSFLASNKSSEVAKLKHELDSINAEKERTKDQLEIVGNKETIKILFSKLADLVEKSHLLKRKLRRKEKEYKEKKELINAVKNWKDIDSYLNNNVY